MLDEMFTRNLQNEFSKDGLKNKRAFKNTKHYKCLIGNRNLIVNTKYMTKRLVWNIVVAL